MGAITMVNLGMSAAMDAIATAQATADNARQMVLNRDPRLVAVEAEQATLAANAARITTLEAKAVTAQRVAVATPALTLLALQQDIPITWPTPFPDTNYGIYPVIEPAGIALGKTTAQVKQGSKTTTGCVITYVSTGIAITAGQTLEVLALRFA